MRCFICHGEQEGHDTITFATTELLMMHVKKEHPLFCEVAIFEKYESVTSGGEL